MDFTKFNFKPESFEETLQKSKEVVIKAIDFNNKVTKDSLKFFDDVTDKYFYAYTTKVAEAANQGTEYAKEFIQTGTVKTLFTNSVKN